MFIIVEGPDRCGKDTLIAGMRKIIETPKILCIHSAAPPRGVDQYEWSRNYYENVIREVNRLSSDGWMIIANRFCHGETVYGKIFRGLNTDYVWALEKELNRETTHLILLTDTAERIYKRDDGLSYGGSSLNYYSTVINAFDIAYDRSFLVNKWKHNVSTDGWANPAEILKRIYRR